MTKGRSALTRRSRDIVEPDESFSVIKGKPLDRNLVPLRVEAENPIPKPMKNFGQFLCFLAPALGDLVRKPPTFKAFEIWQNFKHDGRPMLGKRTGKPRNDGAFCTFDIDFDGGDLADTKFRQDRIAAADRNRDLADIRLASCDETGHDIIRSLEPESKCPVGVGQPDWKNLCLGKRVVLQEFLNEEASRDLRLEPKVGTAWIDRKDTAKGLTQIHSHIDEDALSFGQDSRDHGMNLGFVQGIHLNDVGEVARNTIGARSKP
ncbi:MAG TPA: hypothetical protein PKA03_16795 [Tabrizicola sp.]|nr:hypothetical protein [Tabrizicola sp.]